MTRKRLDTIHAEISLLDSRLAVMLQREAEFDRLLQDMQKVKDSMHADIQSIENQKRELEAERSPTHWLPPEVLTTIFLYVAFPYTEHAEDVYFRPPVILSHVCRKWRDITLLTPQLWSFIFQRSLKMYPAPFKAFIDRSGVFVPLDFMFISTGLEPRQGESQIDVIEQFSATLVLFSGRVRSLTAHLSRTTPLTMLVDSLSQFPLPNISHLDLRSTRPTEMRMVYSARLHSIARWSNLMELRIHHVDLTFIAPNTSLTALRRLTLCYSQETTRFGFLSLNVLCSFLQMSPSLEELVLIDSIPSFDAFPDVPWRIQSNGSALPKIKPVSLPNLKHIEWGWPTRRDILHVFDFISVPGLEKLDLYVEKHEGIIPVATVASLPDSSDTAPLHPRVYPSLREITYQVLGDDFSGTILRRCEFPSLEVVELANVDSRHSHKRRRATGSPFPDLPKIDSIFRDPRMSKLTHLTLSRFRFGMDHKESETFFGYLVSLISLTLDRCAGMKNVMEALGERMSGAIVLPYSYKSSRFQGKNLSLKSCPRLESMILWGCHDLTFADLRAVIQSRNCPPPEAPPFLNVVTGKGNVELRPIKPLRRMRGENVPLPVKTIFPPEESSQISYVRVDDIPAIAESQAMSLMDMGVVNVSWRCISVA